MRRADWFVGLLNFIYPDAKTSFGFAGLVLRLSVPILLVYSETRPITPAKYILQSTEQWHAKFLLLSKYNGTLAPLRSSEGKAASDEIGSSGTIARLMLIKRDRHY